MQASEFSYSGDGSGRAPGRDVPRSADAEARDLVVVLRCACREPGPIHEGAGTAASPVRLGKINASRGRSRPRLGFVASALPGIFAGFLVWALGIPAHGEDNDPAAGPRKAYTESKREYQAHPQDVKAAWQFARATFDLADVIASQRERAEVAQEGISACKQALDNHHDSAPLHYYLGLNEGELARTKTFGALRLVDQMEREFLRAIELDSSFDYAGPDRSLGLLYRDAPAFGSIGSRTKARAHLQRAVELAATYPENRLNLIESELKWGDRKAARQQLKLLEESWPAARTQFTGSAWASSWTDWDSRLDKIKRTLEEPARLESPRH